jgi:hypothetical protein
MDDELAVMNALPPFIAETSSDPNSALVTFKPQIVIELDACGESGWLIHIRRCLLR